MITTTQVCISWLLLLNIIISFVQLIIGENQSTTDDYDFPISPKLWLIIGGIIGIFMSLIMSLIYCTHINDRQYPNRSLIPIKKLCIVVCMLIQIAWLIVGTIFYAQHYTNMSSSELKNMIIASIVLDFVMIACIAVLCVYNKFFSTRHTYIYVYEEI